MKNYYFWDTGTATASAILSFTVVKSGTIKRVSWSGSCVENGGSNGICWSLSFSPVNSSGVQANDQIISQFLLHVDWRSAVGMTATGQNSVDFPELRVSAGQILYFHREAITAAVSASTMKVLVGIT